MEPMLSSSQSNHVYRQAAECLEPVRITSIPIQIPCRLCVRFLRVSFRATSRSLFRTPLECTHFQFIPNLCKSSRNIVSGFSHNSFRARATSSWIRAENAHNSCGTHSELTQNLFRIHAEFMKNSCRTCAESIHKSRRPRPQFSSS